eukprot:GHVS01077433.1.p1 GENE.GHVS01077433.1~~GHVS01077433.1.p1  ORF type:complete len:116 (+),score=2.25 GHVS01077433.1:136-483(+)
MHTMMYAHMQITCLGGKTKDGIQTDKYVISVPASVRLPHRNVHLHIVLVMCMVLDVRQANTAGNRIHKNIHSLSQIACAETHVHGGAYVRMTKQLLCRPRALVSPSREIASRRNS